ncbi:Aste57867_7713 [Aphanomyces stellatus]|uniref:non-specific serine/threonine protein kinase n=1 Tax=Aphanomyces stellatus TaxID=120398 RepID=A0A485KIP2_9STRA|nr:hypothetical protein As57867_007684 [Aphanomyces stellatus]VFT84616.1 Aste57867_7713 [Aphanomyces stellatus]
MMNNMANLRPSFHVVSGMTKTMNPVTATASATAVVLLGRFGHLASRQEVVVDKKNPFIGYFQKALLSPPLERQTSLQKFDWSTNNHFSSTVSTALDGKLRRAASAIRHLPGHPFPPPSALGPFVTPTSQFRENFKETRILGRGGQGKVYEVQSTTDGTRFAIKKVEINQDGSRLKQAMREVQVMAHVPSHRNIVKYYGSWMEEREDETSALAVSTSDSEEESSSSVDSSSVQSSCDSFEPSYSPCGIEFESYSQESNASMSAMSKPVVTKVMSPTTMAKTLFIQMELCEQRRDSIAINNLTTWLRLTGPERVTSVSVHAMALKFFKDVVRGVQHLHEWGIIHRDIKPDNVFLQNGVAKVGDFGLSTAAWDDSSDATSKSTPLLTASSHTTAVGTFLYASPEQVGSGQAKTCYSEKSDIFGLGLILLELCCYFATGMERVQVLTSARHGVLPTPNHYPTEMALVSSMTALDPLDRPSAEQVLQFLAPCHSKLENLPELLYGHYH